MPSISKWLPSFNQIFSTPSKGASKNLFWGQRVLVIVALGGLTALFFRFVYNNISKPSPQKPDPSTLKDKKPTEPSSTPKPLDPSTEKSESTTPNPSLAPATTSPLPDQKNEEIPPSKEPTKDLFWKPRMLPLDVALNKMWRNSRKAFEKPCQELPQKHQGIQRHKLTYNRQYQSTDSFINPYASIEKSLSSIEAITTCQPLHGPLQITCSAAVKTGRRDAMEDAHSFIKIDEGYLAAIFDGHGGDKVARYVNEEIQKEPSVFSTLLKKYNGNVHQTFEALFDLMQEKIVKHSEWDEIGSTALICFIDEKTGLTYTATLGDAEIKLYTKSKEKIACTPFSDVRDWKSLKDAKRAEQALNRPGLADEFMQEPNAKKLRFPYPESGQGVNISRSLGDKQYAKWPQKPEESGKPGIIHKPKLSVHLLKKPEGEEELLLVAGCDGLWDYVSDPEIVKLLTEHKLDEKIAQKIVGYAYETNLSLDNVTVLVLNVKF